MRGLTLHLFMGALLLALAFGSSSCGHGRCCRQKSDRGGAAAQGARCRRPDPVVGAWRMDWFAGPSQDEESLQFAAKQDATPKRWLVVTADGKGALVSAEGVTVRCGAMFKQVAYSAETGLPVPEAPAPVEPPLEFIWWRTGERYFVRLASLFGSESTEATLSGGRLMTTSWDGSPSWVLKRDPHPPAGVERRLRGEPSPVSASPPSFWDIPE